MSSPSCPKCAQSDSYPDGNLLICPHCGHEWVPGSEAATEEEVSDSGKILDANGVALQDGDSVVLIKDLKVKGSSNAIKVGTKVRSIRLRPDATDGHNISCKVDGFGAMYLKSEFVRKS
jgi:protein PhnA